MPTMILARLDEQQTQVVVEFTYKPGSAGGYSRSGFEPDDPPEIEIEQVDLVADPLAPSIKPTEAEVEKWVEVIADTYVPDDPDDNYDPDEWRDWNE